MQEKLQAELRPRHLMPEELAAEAQRVMCPGPQAQAQLPAELQLEPEAQLAPSGE